MCSKYLCETGYQRFTSMLEFFWEKKKKLNLEAKNLKKALDFYIFKVDQVFTLLLWLLNQRGM